MALQPILSTHVRERSEPDHPYTEYNNYVIFKQSFHHLIENKLLYQFFEFDHWDFYKYSPTFALLFGIFAGLPDWLGLILWNLLNSLVFVFAISRLNHLSEFQRTLFLFFTLLEMNTNLVNNQANGLMAGLMLLFFSFQEKGKYSIANFLLCLSVFIKIFSILGFLLLFLYPNRWERILNALLWGVFFAILPLLVTDFESLIAQYENWLLLLKNDSSFGAGLSFHRFFTILLNFEFDKSLSLAFGLILFILSFLKVYLNNDSFRLKVFFWAQLMIWVIIFNHRAESPTYIIALSGLFLAMFQFYNNKSFFIAISIFSILLTSLTATDLFSGAEVKKWIYEYSVKAIPAICIWFLLVYHSLTFTKNKPSLKPN
ncbi:MAG: glycosyltransferase family 87 protein [Cytophagales bacterium]